jgi:hypothetical protein
MINIFNRLIFDVKYFDSWKKDDFFWFPVSALRFQVSSLATFHLSPVTIVTPETRSGQLGGLVTPEPRSA